MESQLSRFPIPTQNEQLVCKTEKFACNQCNTKLKNARTLKAHVKYVHQKANPWPCKLDGCQLRFQRKSDMRRHLSSHFVGIQTAYCGTCDIFFTRKDSLIDHKNSFKHRSAKKNKAREQAAEDAAHDATDSLSARYSDEQKAQQSITWSTESLWCAGIDNGAGYKVCQRCKRTFLRIDQLCDHHVKDKCFLNPNGAAISTQPLDHSEAPDHQTSNEESVASRPYGFDATHSTRQEFAPSVDGLEDGSRAHSFAPNLRIRESSVHNSMPSKDYWPAGITYHDPQLRCFIQGCLRKHSNAQEYIDHLNHHTNDAIGTCRYACNGCDATFHHPFELDLHQKDVKHLKKGEGRCYCCGHVFGTLGVGLHGELGIHLNGFHPPAGLDASCYKKRKDGNTALIARIQHQIATLYLNSGITA